MNFVTISSEDALTKLKATLHCICESWFTSDAVIYLVYQTLLACVFILIGLLWFLPTSANGSSLKALSVKCFSHCFFFFFFFPLHIFLLLTQTHAHALIHTRPLLNLVRALSLCFRWCRCCGRLIEMREGTTAPCISASLQNPALPSTSASETVVVGI